jgi:hypothetical protein
MLIIKQSQLLWLENTVGLVQIPGVILGDNAILAA